MTPVPVSFRTRAVYWPPHAGVYLWEGLQAPRLAQQLDLAANAGFRRLAITLAPNEFQPAPDRVSAPAMHILDRLLGFAADRDQDVLVTILAAEIEDYLWLPSWALRPETGSARLVLTGQSVTRRLPIDPFSAPRATGGQRRLVAEVTGAFGDHPGVAGWVVADQIDAVMAPESAGRFSEWLSVLLDSVSPRARSAPLLYGMGSRSLVRARTIAVSTLRQMGLSLLVHDSWRPAWARGAEAEWTAFLGGYATALADRPASVYFDPVRAGDERALAHVAESGAAEAIAPFLFTLDPAVAGAVPFRGLPRDRTQGLMSSDGTLTAAGALWRDVSASPGEVLAPPAAFAGVDPERRDAEPETVARETFEELVR